MRNLGRYVAIIIATITCNLYASVELSISPKVVTQGDSVRVNLSIDGTNFVEPKISTLCGYNIEGTSKSSNMQNINGNISKTVTLGYTITPAQSCNIEPIEIEVDGVMLQTNPLHVEVKKYVADKNAPFVVNLKTKAKEIYVGEPFVVELSIKERLGSGAIDSQFSPPSFDNFWVKSQSKPIRKEQNGFSLVKIVYVLAAQSTKATLIQPASLKIATRQNTQDIFAQWMQRASWKNYFSNSLNFNVKPLPKGVEIIGDVTLHVDVDKTSTLSNEPVNLTLTLKGSANFEDINSLEPKIKGVSIYADKPAITPELVNGKYSAIMSQKMALISDKSYVIEPIVISYFDIKSKTVKTIKSKPINIEVKKAPQSATQNERLKIERSNDNAGKESLRPDSNLHVVESLNVEDKALWYVLGFISATVLMLIPFKRLFSNDKRVKVSLKSDKDKLNFLMKHIEDREVEEMVSKLEEKIYNNNGTKIDKKLLKELIKRYS